MKSDTKLLSKEANSRLIRKLASKSDETDEQPLSQKIHTERPNQKMHTERPNKD